MATTFRKYIGIDYSGAKTASSRLPGLQLYVAHRERPRKVLPPERRFKNWCRRELCQWLIEQAGGAEPFIVGIDHGFSFPLSYFRRSRLKTWDDFLEDFSAHWPTHQDGVDMDSVRSTVSEGGGEPTEFRLTEKWTSSAKSVFHFDVQGSVAKSTHAGLPWLGRIRREMGSQLHFWPFDGWQVPAGKSVIAEVYPALYRNRYPRGGRTADEQDAYSVARWLSEADRRGILARYFEPPLTARERRIAAVEGWILGVS